MSTPNRQKGSAGDYPILNPVRKLPPAGPGSQWGEDISSVVHHGVFCNGPLCVDLQQPIHGMRYKCSVCPKDFCNQCVRQPSSSHERDHTLWECPDRCSFETVDGADVRVTQQLYELGDLDVEQDESDDVAVQIATERSLADQHNYVPARFVPQRAEPASNTTVQHHDHPIIMAKVEAGSITEYDHQDLPLRSTNSAGINVSAPIRLLHLLPGAPGDELKSKFSLKHLTDDIEPYDVVSCSWDKLLRKNQRPGEVLANGRDIDPPAAEEKKYAVYLEDDKFVEASVELRDALLELRDTENVRTLWVDELCVDQRKDQRATAERRFQTRASSLIHARASKTIVWTGLGNEDTEAAMWLMWLLSHRCVDDEQPTLLPSHVDADPNLPPLSSPDFREIFRLFPSMILKKGCEFHDAVFAKEAEFRCGEYSVEWWQVIAVARMLTLDPWKSAANGQRSTTSSDELVVA